MMTTSNPEALAVGEAPWPPSSRAWWAVGVFCIAAILSYSDRQILSLLVDPIRADLHATDVQIGLLQGAAFALIYAVAGVGLGRAADVLPRRLVIVAGIVVWSLATVGSGMATSDEPAPGNGTIRPLMRGPFTRPKATVLLFAAIEEPSPQAKRHPVSPPRAANSNSASVGRRLPAHFA